MEVTDAANGSEDGRLDFNTVVAGVLGTKFTVEQGFYSPNATGGDQGADTTNVIQHYQNGNPLMATRGVISAQRGSHFEATNTITLDLLTATSATSGFMISLRNAGSGVITIDPNGSETINGASTLTLQAGFFALIIYDGS